MSQITSATSTAATGTSGTTVSRADSSVLSKDQFLQLMMAELKNQDPLSASNQDPTQYMTQLAQFTTLEQETNTAQSTSQLASAQSSSAALALLGRNVTYTDPTGAVQTGTVQKVDFSSSGPTLTINGNTGIDPSSVSEVS
jgi:flagellar basal-body rod modification protein FlgD